MSRYLNFAPRHPLPPNAVIILDSMADETPPQFKTIGAYGVVKAITPYEVNGRQYYSYTLGTIDRLDESEGGGYSIHTCDDALYVPAHVVTQVKGLWEPVEECVSRDAYIHAYRDLYPQQGDPQ